MKCPKCKSENVSVDLVQVEGKTKKAHILQITSVFTGSPLDSLASVGEEII